MHVLVIWMHKLGVLDELKNLGLDKITIVVL